MAGILNQLDFTGRRVLVTGGAKGIGRAVVQSFVELGATVIIFDKDESALESLRNTLAPKTITSFPVDLSNWEVTRKVTKSILPIHHLVNNAGTMVMNEFLNIQEQDIDLLFEINFKAALNIGQVVAQGMIDHEVKGGTIVNMSSTTDTTGYKRQAVHAATKAALTSLTKTMANELGPHGIRVNCVRPSLVNTELVAGLPEATLKNLTDYFWPRSAIPGLIEPREVANVVIFLSSPMSTMVTGTPLTIDGGFGTS